MSDRYARFLELAREQRQLGCISSLLNWDEQTYLPPAGAAGRAEQMAILAKITHERTTAPEFCGLVAELRDAKDLTEDQRVCVREIAREVDRATKVPGSLVAAISEAESITHHQWLHARKEANFQLVSVQMGKLLGLKRQFADCLGTGATRYETMLDLYETGLTVKDVERWFGTLRPALTELVGQFESGAKVARFAGIFPQAEQERFLQECLGIMEFDRTRGRLDTTAHPFCLDLGFDDIRLTIRYAEDDFAPALYATMHEAGHGLYELGFSPEYAYTPLAQYATMAVHESQSRFWENMIGRSPEFLDFLLPRLQSHFPQAMSDVSLPSVIRHVNRVERSLIRVEADEVSYGLHVIIRFELERLLVSGELPLADLPAAWNERYREYLGVVAPTDADGVLQDIHWFIGHFGYFPTYLIGSCYAAQLFAALEADRPALRGEISRGELTAVRQWLVEKIHCHGRRYFGNELIERATGKPAGAGDYLSYLRKKFDSLPSL